MLLVYTCKHPGKQVSPLLYHSDILLHQNRSVKHLVNKVALKCKSKGQITKHNKWETNDIKSHKMILPPPRRLYVFVCVSVMKKLVDRLSWNWLEGCGISHGSTDYILAWIRIREQIQELSLLSLTLWDTVILNICVDFSKNKWWILMEKKSGMFSGLIFMSVCNPNKKKSHILSHNIRHKSSNNRTIQINEEVYMNMNTIY